VNLFRTTCTGLLNPERMPGDRRVGGAYESSGGCFYGRAVRLKRMGGRPLLQRSWRGVGRLLKGLKQAGCSLGAPASVLYRAPG